MKRCPEPAAVGSGLRAPTPAQWHQHRDKNNPTCWKELTCHLFITETSCETGAVPCWWSDLQTMEFLVWFIVRCGRPRQLPVYEHAVSRTSVLEFKKTYNEGKMPPPGQRTHFSRKRMWGWVSQCWNYFATAVKSSVNDNSRTQEGPRPLNHTSTKKIIQREASPGSFKELWRAIVLVKQDTREQNQGGRYKPPVGFEDGVTNWGQRTTSSAFENPTLNALKLNNMW